MGAEERDMMWGLPGGGNGDCVGKGIQGKMTSPPPHKSLSVPCLLHLILTTASAVDPKVRELWPCAKKEQLFCLGKPSGTCSVAENIRKSRGGFSRAFELEDQGLNLPRHTVETEQISSTVFRVAWQPP